MILDYIVIGVIIASIIAILAIVGRKFPVLASISVGEIPRHKQERVKSALIAGRLYRRLESLNKPLAKAFEFFRSTILVFLHKIWANVKDLERRHTLPEHQLSAKEKVNREEHIKELLFEADQLAKDESFAEAEKKYIETISLDPDNIDAFTRLGKVYVSMNDFQHAKESFNYSLKLRIHQRSVESTGAPQPVEGEQKAEQSSASLDRLIADHYIDLGEVYVLTEEPVLAQKCFEEAIHLEPNNPRNLDTLFDFAVSMKNKPLAYEALKKLRVADPDNQKLGELEQQIDKM
ncbi:MAG: hypothetical protein A2898_04790 [Candidatus Kerfeldbacteria bacterium RIFCSPLOWO2_01_FULL_48_11]|uniref:Bacterial transcriptional activator domain-containing protein n=1 Tax=Candidatus Kerfeldbacteria bacterium RIFCSPLOWO2_01_FULL_48_11 TaxID=1798543 RepID=A0A1G2B0Y7_9BACT|nr:MAG: Tetratricopeptide TPR_2 repeat protein [Parcubacteria group bacterium GW2011_GWA2_48_9]KKW13707.1 MAG: Tetratricopeptide TPR_2 repeat protein [Parcubacteria group bacterium GW2011_GWC2_49_9]OGY82871.1 MAG: hypothetical protein A2898_04790 [Candidatus Kerfeldbacteria bacterium RIFCSPLOWO2_01_FULL_48_11]